MSLLVEWFLGFDNVFAIVIVFLFAVVVIVVGLFSCAVCVADLFM